jgi:acyl dehydratase
MGVHLSLVGQSLERWAWGELGSAALVTRRTWWVAGQGYIGSMKTFDTLADLAAHVGQTVAVSNWITVTQEHINLFAQATGDHQWIHVDVERAKAGPFGAPIAHGFLTLSLIPRFFDEAIAITQVRMGVNYGLNKVRFIAPVPVDSRLRAHLKLLASDAIDNDGRQQTWEVTIEREGSAKPVCVAESLSRAYP